MRVLGLLAAWGAVLLAGAAGGRSPAAQEHVRGDVVSVQGRTVEVRERGGEKVELRLADDARIALVEKGDLASVRDGAFVGTTAVPQPDGTLRALEVHVFPDSMRGTGEGQRPWDLAPGSTMTNATVAGGGPAGGGGSTMTNATVASVDARGGERRLSLRYAGGEQTVVVPAGTPVVAIAPGDRSKLVPGAHLFAIATRAPDGTLVAERLNVGEGGVVPPM